MSLISGYLRGDRLRTGVRASLPMKRLKSGMLWCDEPSHAAYNRPTRAPFSAGHEKLCRTDELYNLCIVLDWNITSRIRGRGSAIFFHVARPGFTPTEGCVALCQRDLARILPHLRTRSRLVVL